MKSSGGDSSFNDGQPLLELRSSGGSALGTDIFRLFRDGRATLIADGSKLSTTIAMHEVVELTELTQAVAAIPARRRLEDACATCSSTLHEVDHDGYPLIRTSGLCEETAELLLERLERMAGELSESTSS